MWIHNWKSLNLAEITVFQHSDDSGSKPVKRRRWTMISVFNGEAFVCLVMSLRSPSVPFLGINSRTQSLSMQSVFLWVPLIHSISSGFYMVLCRTDTKLTKKVKRSRQVFLRISLFIGSNLYRTLNWDTIHQHQLQRKLPLLLLSVHHMSGIEVMHHIQ